MKKFITKEEDHRGSRNPKHNCFICKLVDQEDPAPSLAVEISDKDWFCLLQQLYADAAGDKS